VGTKIRVEGVSKVKSQKSKNQKFGEYGFENASAVSAASAVKFFLIFEDQSLLIARIAKFKNPEGNCAHLHRIIFN
jgi:hypothetical protein